MTAECPGAKNVPEIPQKISVAGKNKNRKFQF